MSVREKIRLLTFHDAESDWDNDFGSELVEWSAKFRPELHGDETACGGIATATPDDFGSTLKWDKVPPGDKQFLGNLERFVGRAFRMSVYLRLVVEPVNMDEVESEYLAEEEEEEDGDAV